MKDSYLQRMLSFDQNDFLSWLRSKKNNFVSMPSSPNGHSLANFLDDFYAKRLLGKVTDEGVIRNFDFIFKAQPSGDKLKLVVKVFAYVRKSNSHCALEKVVKKELGQIELDDTLKLFMTLESVLGQHPKMITGKQACILLSTAKQLIKTGFEPQSMSFTTIDVKTTKKSKKAEMADTDEEQPSQQEDTTVESTIQAQEDNKETISTT
jgi:hypothetical protein